MASGRPHGIGAGFGVMLFRGIPDDPSFPEGPAATEGENRQDKPLTLNGSTDGCDGQAVPHSTFEVIGMEWYLIWATDKNAWWAEGQCGYAHSVAEAGRYTAHQAIEIVCDDIQREQIVVRLADAGNDKYPARQNLAQPGKPKIFVFVNSGDGTDWQQGEALTEDGQFIASHVSSSRGFFRHDMGLTGEWQHDKYKAHYPDGYELVEVPEGEIRTHAGLVAAYAKHRASAPTEPAAASA